MPTRVRRRPPTVLLAGVPVLLAGLAALAAVGALGGLDPISHAAGQQGQGRPTAQTDDSIPARRVTMIGSSPAEAADETWGIGEVGAEGSQAFAIVRYTADGGWELAPSPLDAAGQPLCGFQPASGPLTGELTASGAGALLGTVPSGGSSRKVVLVRNPGTPFRETGPIPEGEAGLRPGEILFGPNRAPLLAALDEGGHAGALLVPVSRESSAVEDGVLHWDGEHWTREPIEPPRSEREAGGFRVLALRGQLAAERLAAGPAHGEALATWRSFADQQAAGRRWCPCP
jgi:hypothetical protein